MAWLHLVLAGVCEIGWPVGLKLGWTDQGARPWWIIFAIVAMTASGALLLWAQRPGHCRHCRPQACVNAEQKWEHGPCV